MERMRVERQVAAAAEILAGNRIEMNGYRYTAPSLDDAVEIRKDYANQFQWDTCFHAIAWRWIDPVMAQDELKALVSRQVADGPDAGMIPHCNYWRGGGEYLWGRAERSLLTQPPLIAIAALLIHDKRADRSFLEAVYGPVCRYHDWFDRRRDSDGDGLVSLIHPWESGTDALPRWDAALGLSNPTYEEARAARMALAAEIVARDADPVALAGAGYFSVEPMDYNAIRTADLEALGTIAALLGKAEEAANWRRRAARVRTALRKTVFDGEPFDLQGAAETPVRMASSGQFVAMLGGFLTRLEMDRLVARLQEPRFWTLFPVPTSPTDDPTFVPTVYWRGNVWPSVNWLIYEALKRNGYDAIATRLAERIAALVERSGFREYYNPLTGDGLGGVRFSWATAFIDILRREAA